MADEFDTTPGSGSGKASGAGQGVEGESDRTDDSDSSPSALSLGGPASEVVKSSKTKSPTLKSSSFLFSCQQHFVFFSPHLLVLSFRIPELLKLVQKHNIVQTCAIDLCVNAGLRPSCSFGHFFRIFLKRIRHPDSCCYEPYDVD